MTLSYTGMAEWMLCVNQGWQGVAKAVFATGFNRLKLADGNPQGQKLAKTQMAKVVVFLVRIA